MNTSPQPAPIRWTEVGLLLLSAAALFLVAHFPALVNEYVINDDVRQQIFWMQQWQDPELFRHDLLAEYARHYVPWGVKGLYWLAAGLMSPLWFSKLLPGFLFVCLSLCLYLITLKILDRRLAWITVGVFWLMPFFLGRLAGGLPRAFAAPLLAVFLLAWLADRPRSMALSVLAMALFIPYIFPLAAGAALLGWADSRCRAVSGPPFPRRPGHFVWLVLGALLVVLFNYQLTAAGFGPLVSAADMAGRLEFSSRGRYPVVPPPSFLWELAAPWEYIAPFREAGIFAGALVCVLLLVAAVAGLRRLDWRTWPGYFSSSFSSPAGI